MKVADEDVEHLNIIIFEAKGAPTTHIIWSG